MSNILIILLLILSGGVIEKSIYKKPQVEIPKAYIKSLNNDNIPNSAIELKLLHIIPSKIEAEEKQIYFKNLSYYYVDARGMNYIVDSALCIIYEIDVDGNLVNKYNKRGQGPGELLSPQRLFVNNNKIYVWDSRPLRMTRFNINWEYEKSFSIFETISPNDISGDGNIICSNRRGDTVVNIIDMEGNNVYSFGEKPYMNNIISRLNESIIKISPDGYIYVGFTAIGKIRKYTIKGKMEKEIDIINSCSKLIKEILDINYAQDKNNTNIISPIIQSIAFIKEDILISIGGLVQPIIRINKYGEIIGYYYIKPKYGMDKKCVYADIDKNGNERYYFIINEMSEKYIAVYSRK